MFPQQCFLIVLFLKCIERMKEEISDAQKDKEQYTQEEEWMREQAPSLFSESVLNYFEAFQ